jgi:hypothetical protein
MSYWRMVVTWYVILALFIWAGENMWKLFL